MEARRSSLKMRFFVRVPPMLDVGMCCKLSSIDAVCCGLRLKVIRRLCTINDMSQTLVERAMLMNQRRACRERFTSSAHFERILLSKSHVNQKNVFSAMLVHSEAVEKGTQNYPIMNA